MVTDQDRRYADKDARHALLATSRDDLRSDAHVHSMGAPGKTWKFMPEGVPCPHVLGAQRVDNICQPNARQAIVVTIRSATGSTTTRPDSARTQRWPTISLCVFHDRNSAPTKDMARPLLRLAPGCPDLLPSLAGPAVAKNSARNHRAPAAALHRASRRLQRRIDSKRVRTLVESLRTNRLLTPLH